MDLIEAKEQVRECLKSKDIENITEMLPFNDLGERIMKLLRYIEDKPTCNISEIKERIAIKNGYQSGIFNSAWEYAMISSHRKKEQSELYEQVIAEILT